MPGPANSQASINAYCESCESTYNAIAIGLFIPFNNSSLVRFYMPDLQSWLSVPRGFICALVHSYSLVMGFWVKNTTITFHLFNKCSHCCSILSRKSHSDRISKAVRGGLAASEHRYVHRRKCSHPVYIKLHRHFVCYRNYVARW